MKRVVSFLLAAAMTVSMASVAFAAVPDVYIDNDSALYYYDSDTGRLEDATGHEFEPGEAIYIQIQGTGKDDSDSYRSMHVYADWDVGSNLVESMDIVYKKVNTVTSSQYVPKTTAPAGMADSYNDLPALENAAKELFAKNYKVVGATGYLLNGKYYETAADALTAADYKATEGGYVKDGAFTETPAGVTLYAYPAWVVADWKTVEGGATIYGATTDLGWTMVTEANPVWTAEKTPVALVEYKNVDGQTGFTYKQTTGYVNNDTQRYAATKEIAGIEWVKAKTGYAYDGKLFETEAKAAKAAGYQAVGAGYTKGDVYSTETAALTAAGCVANDKAGYVDSDKNFTAGDQASFVANMVNSYKLTQTTAGKYNYVVEIVTVDSTPTRVRDLAGDVRIATTKSKDVPTCKLGIEIKNPKYGDGKPVYSVYIDKDSGEVVKFADDADVIDIEFGEDALFTVNVNGQSELNLGYSTKFNSEFASKYDDANIDFISWGATPSFNRIGDLYIFADEDSYIYEVTADGAKAVANAEYDDDYGAWHIRTRTLKSYAISDMKLKTTSSSSSSSSSSTPSGGGSTTGKPNPNTGR